MTVALINLNKLTNQFTMIFCKCLHLEIVTERPISLDKTHFTI